MKRYRPYYFDQRNAVGFDATMRENSEGDYVLYADYLAEIAARDESLEKYKRWAESCDPSPEVQAELSRLTAEVQQLRTEYVACIATVDQLENEERVEVQRYREALESIVQTHEAYCEQHIGVSAHSYSLAEIANRALLAEPKDTHP